MPITNSPSLPHLRHEKAWIILGGVSLAAIAGYVNVILLGFFHVPISHMSGAASRIGIDIVSGNVGDLRVLGGIVMGFFTGAVVSGLAIGQSQLKPGRRYGLILVAEAIVLAAATLLLRRNNHWGVPMAATACGLQNAMASSYYGMVIRTTHVTGIVTDMGIMLGHWLRGEPIQRWRAVLLIGLFGGFLGGGVAGAVFFQKQNVDALTWASVACLTAGLFYGAWLHFQRGDS